MKILSFKGFKEEVIMWAETERITPVFCSLVWVLLWPAKLAYSKINPELVEETTVLQYSRGQRIF